MPTAWIYRMANDAKRHFEKCSTHSQSTPVNATSMPHLDHAMSTLDEALEDLGKLRVRFDNDVAEWSALKLSTEQLRASVEIFIELVSSMAIPDIFPGNLDLNVLRALPDVYDSPFVSVYAGLRVLFFNALYYGLDHSFGPGNHFAQAAYKKILETVPEWLNSATGSGLDAHVAALTTWTSINNLDCM